MGLQGSEGMSIRICRNLNICMLMSTRLRMGDTCNGKLKVVLSEKGTYCVCHRDKTHKWKIEYNDVMNMIK